jgi:hypothetical protein
MRRLGRSAYGAFVAQGPVLVLIALALRPADLPGDIKFLVLAPTAVIVSFGLTAAAHAFRADKPRSTTSSSMVHRHPSGTRSVRGTHSPLDSAAPTCSAGSLGGGLD